MGTGEWLIRAAEADGTGGTPVWATILVAIIAVVGPVLAYVAARHNTNALRLSSIEADSTQNRAIEQARDAARQASEIAQHANALAASKSNRDLILAAVELTNSDDEKTWRKGFAMLDGLSRMKGLDPDDAILIDSLTSPVTEGTMERLRQEEKRQVGEVGDDRDDRDK